MNEPGFAPPPYPYDGLAEAKATAEAHEGGVVDLSVGTPCDPPAPSVVAALGSSDAERGYPYSIGSLAYRQAACEWMERRFDVSVAPSAVAACVGTKEFVATLPQWLRLRSPARDTVLCPAVAYPTYEMGAVLAGCRAVRYTDLASVSADDAGRALCLWVNSPANPTGAVADLEAAASWGRAHDVPVFSDECYVEFTWDGPRRTILAHGPEGVVAVHSLSKRSNLAGVRAGFYAGDEALVSYLAEVRKHVGLIVPGPVQAAAVVAWGDDAHVEEQRGRYRHRLELCRDVLAAVGASAPLPQGGFYLWAPAPDGDDWAFTTRLARDGGCLVSPGRFFGEAGRGHVRIAMVQPVERLRLVAARLEAAR